MATTGESGNGPASNVGPVCSGYPKFRLLLLLATTATMAAVLLLEVATAAAVIPLNFAATACSADHISLFSVYYFFTVISNFDEQQILPQIFSFVHSFFLLCLSFPWCCCCCCCQRRNSRPETEPTQRTTRVGPQQTPLYSIKLGRLGAPLFWHSGTAKRKFFLHTGTERRGHTKLLSDIP